MPHAVRATAAAALLAGPAAIAFFSGGFFDDARLAAGVVAWALVAVAALTVDPPLPRSTSARIALAGLALLTAWTAISIAWAPLAGPAVDDVQRLLLYLGAFVAAAAFLREPLARRALEPALAAGAVVVIGYGLAGRLLPGLIELSRSFSAGGRLEQPLTYWNAMGAVAAIGLVLCARLAGDERRPRVLRAAAAAGAAPLGMGLYLSFSRGGLAAAAAGIAALLLLSPTWPQLRAAGIAIAVAAAGAVAAAPFAGVRALEGDLPARERDGAVVLVLLLAVMAGAALAQTLASRRASGRLRLPLRALAIGLVLAVVAGGALLAAGWDERRVARDPARGAAAERLRSIESNRYAYWEVAAGAFADHPLRGIGSGGFRVEWLRERDIPEPVRDAHSLYLETAAELGIVGLALLGLTLAGVGLTARRAMRLDAAGAAGACAALAVWTVHAGLDWDWEMPAVTLIAVVLAGALAAMTEALRAGPGPPARRSRPTRARAAESPPSAEGAGSRSR